MEAWQTGNPERLDLLLNHDFHTTSGGQPLFQRLVTETNIAMAAKVRELLENANGRSFVVIGVQHVVGPGSVPQRLREAGYTVTGGQVGRRDSEPVKKSAAAARRFSIRGDFFTSSQTSQSNVDKGRQRARSINNLMFPGVVYGYASFFK